MKKIILTCLSIAIFYIFSLTAFAEISFTQEVQESKEKLILADAKWSDYSVAIDSIIAKYSTNPAMLSKIYKKLATVEAKLGNSNPIGSKNYKIMAIVEYFNTSILNEFAKNPIIISAYGKIDYASLADGTYKREDENAEVFSEFSVMNGKLEWPFSIYHDNGKIDTTMTFKNDQIKWEALLYTPLGELDAIETYSNGNIVSVKRYNLSLIESEELWGIAYNYVEYFYSAEWYIIRGDVYNKSNRKTYTFNYNKEGELHGETIEYSDTAENRVVQTYMMVNGVEEWEAKTYDSITGNLKQKWMYSGGELNGMAYVYDKNWAVVSSVNYTNGLKNGEEKIYFVHITEWTTNGNVGTLNIYENGVLKSTTRYNPVDNSVLEVIVY